MQLSEKLIYVTTSGGSIGEFNMGYDYVRTLAWGLFGIKDIQFFSAENLDIYGNDVEAIMQEAEAKVKASLNKLTAGRLFRPVLCICPGYAKLINCKF